MTHTGKQLLAEKIKLVFNFSFPEIKDQTRKESFINSVIADAENMINNELSLKTLDTKTLSLFQEEKTSLFDTLSEKEEIVV